MQLKNLLSVSAVAAALAGCASGPDLTKVSDLKVYPDNRIGYTLLSNGTQPARVWSTGETILALRFGSRIINAKDLDYVIAQRTNKKYVPLHITAQLKSGEAMVADVSDWGMSAYSDMTVEWLACGKEKSAYPSSLELALSNSLVQAISWRSLVKTGLNHFSCRAPNCRTL